jgi:clan AA aspartic protease (TIGR02281 family)
MTTEGPADGEAPIFHSVTSRKRRRGGVPVAAVVVGAVVMAGAGGAGVYFLRGPGAAPASRAAPATQAKPWILPEGVASMGEAERCLRDRDLPCAEADLLAYLKQYPNDAHANALLAITLTQDGRHREALVYYRKAESLGVDTYDFYAGYAKSLDATGDIDGAIEKNRAALKIVPRLVDVRGALADELVRKGRGKEAVELLESFDRQLESEGYQPYFAEQIARIKKGMGGDYAKEAAAEQAPPAPGQTLVKGAPEAGTLAVPASIDGAPPMSFIVDSGASLVSIPWDDAEPFIKTGLIKPGDFQGEEPFQLANGERVTARIYRLHSLKVGDREVKDVLAAVYRGHGPRLLGQSFLKRFKSWSIDNGRRVLVLTD